MALPRGQGTVRPADMVRCSGHEQIAVTAPDDAVDQKTRHRLEEARLARERRGDDSLYKSHFRAGRLSRRRWPRLHIQRLQSGV